MSIEQNSIVEDIGIRSQCKICGGRGTIQIYRSDLEEFDEIKCVHCK